MMVILLNCVTLGMYQPCEDMDCLSDRCKILQVFDDFIFIFFAMEMVLKMVALGIFGKKCYLGDTWNRLDFFIVMAGSKTERNLFHDFYPIVLMRSQNEMIVISLEYLISKDFC
ncbi:hypothetical protein DUI87_20362 [Hirundo rustica rustica]|uniref:Ion transport domain-containing protein n=1 Tax=Hirundo rustica rustica TaxID=333673 RepID=A0A3M0JQ63_HIRRU|nr:hypothetical protein DUI87_20362 [Hirundo rustica rustica]